MKMTEPFSMICDMVELGEFIGVADEDLKKQIASHIATIGILAAEATTRRPPKDEEESDDGKEEEEKNAPVEDARRYYVGDELVQCVVGFTALSEILRDYDVRIGFIPRFQLLMFVKTPTAIPESLGPAFIESSEEFLSVEGEKAAVPLTVGVADVFYDYGGSLFRYRQNNEGEYDEEDDDEDDDELDDDSGEEWKKGKRFDDDDE